MEKILVLFGGVSSEHEVSLVSAASVIKNLPGDRFTVIPVGITADGRWYLYKGDPDQLPGGRWLEDPTLLAPTQISLDRGRKGLLVFGGGRWALEEIDAVFPVLHGANGEDGTMQGLLEISGLPYVGCTTLSSAMCMDKEITNTIADSAGVKQAKWLSVRQAEYLADPEKTVREAGETLGYPIFVKPANTGSSVGITKAAGAAQLGEGIENAFRYDAKIVLEAAVRGAEIECAVIGNGELSVSQPGEIVPCNEFYDYDAKYVSSGSRLHIPARIEAEAARQVRETAGLIYRALCCSGMARVDFFVDTASGDVYFNEINTIPGFTPISMFPKMFEAAGLPYPRLLSALIDLALEKKRKTSHD